MTQLPHGMVQVGQNPYPPLADRYLADRISGFSIRALPRYATKPLAEIMATTGTPQSKRKNTHPVSITTSRP